MSRAQDRAIAEAARGAAKVFAYHGWVWGGGDAAAQVPQEAEIALTIAGLIQTLGKGEGTVSTGRLHVHRGDLEEDGDDRAVYISMEIGQIEA